MKKLFILTIVVIFSVRINAQVEERFQSLLETDLKEFTQPLATSIGIGFNSGNYHNAYVPNLFGFSIGLRGMLMLIPKNQLTFTPKGLPEHYTADKKTATIFGEKGAAYAGPLGYITYPAGINKSYFPLVTPQASVSMFGTELMLRFIPEIQVGDETLNLFGFGIKHSISRYFPLLPINIAIQFTNNTFSVSKIFKVNSYAFNVHASKSLGLAVVYGGIQYESSSLDLEYTYKDENGTAKKYDGKKLKLNFQENNIRVTAGASINLAFFVINADYSIAKQNTASVGISFEF